MSQRGISQRGMSQRGISQRGVGVNSCAVGRSAKSRPSPGQECIYCISSFSTKVETGRLRPTAVNLGSTSRWFGSLTAYQRPETSAATNKEKPPGNYRAAFTLNALYDGLSFRRRLCSFSLRFCGTHKCETFWRIEMTRVRSNVNRLIQGRQNSRCFSTVIRSASVSS